MKPEISVIMSVYNCANWVDAAVESLRAQTFRYFELIIVDDGSTDATYTALKRHQEQDTRIHVFRNERNLGIATSSNIALQHARAPLIAKADGDDVFPAHRFAVQREYMTSHPEVGLSSGSYFYIDEKGHKLRQVQHFPTDDTALRFWMCFMFPFQNSGMIYRRELAEYVHGYAEAYNRGAEDYDFTSRMADITQLGNVPQIVVLRRLRGSSIVATEGKRIFADSYGISRRLLSKILDREIEYEKAAAMGNLFLRGMTLSAEEIAMTLELGREIVQAKDDTIKKPERHSFCRKFGLALMKQSINQSYRDRQLSRRLFCEAFRMSSALVWNWRTYIQTLRLGRAALSNKKLPAVLPRSQKFRNV